MLNIFLSFFPVDLWSVLSVCNVNLLRAPTDDVGLIFNIHHLQMQFIG